MSKVQGGGGSVTMWGRTARVCFLAKTIHLYFIVFNSVLRRRTLERLGLAVCFLFKKSYRRLWESLQLYMRIL